MERPDHPSGYVRSGLYAKAPPATLDAVTEAVVAFLSKHGERLEAIDGKLDDGVYKTDGLLGVAIRSSSAFIGVVDSAPRDGHWLPVFAPYLQRRVQGDVFVYWTGVPKQSLAESQWHLAAGAGKKSTSWKKTIAEVEALPDPYVRYADLAAAPPAPTTRQLVFRMNRSAFEHALEFDKKGF